MGINNVLFCGIFIYYFPLINYCSNCWAEVGDYDAVKLSTHETRSEKKQYPMDRETTETNSVVRKEEDTIVVTGTHIKGVVAAGSNVIVLDKEEISKAGYATVRDLFESLPQNFGGGPTGELKAGNAEGYNTTMGAAINLRGLGNVNTLSLVNGRRIPTTGFDNSVADISNIPLSAIERIEILPDGSSAVYGSDAVAGVINFVLKKNYTGLEIKGRYGTVTRGSVDEYNLNATTGSSWNTGNIILAYELYHKDALPARERSFSRSQDLRRLGGKDYRLPYGNPGNIVNPGTLEILYVIPPGQDGTAIAPQDLLPPSQADLMDEGNYWQLLPRQHRHSFFGYINQELKDNVSVYMDGRFTRRISMKRQSPGYDLIYVPPTNPYYIDVFGNREPLYIAYRFPDEEMTVSRASVKSISISGGATFLSNNGWSIDAYTSFSRDRGTVRINDAISSAALAEAAASNDPLNAFNPFGEGGVNSPDIINKLKYDSITVMESDLYENSIIANGPFATLRGNTIKVALGGNQRTEKYDRSRQSYLIPFEKAVSFKRNVYSLFGEMQIPIISEKNNDLIFDGFDLSASIRYDRYKDKINFPSTHKFDPDSTINPRFGILVEPINGMKLRGTYGSSFRAPSLHTRASPTLVYSLPLLDISSGRRLNALVLQGPQSNLKNETSKNWSIGLDISSDILQHGSFNFSYFNIDFKDQVTSPQLGQNILNDTSMRELVSFNPGVDQVKYTCSLASDGQLFVDPRSCTTPGMYHVIVDLRERNMARTVINGIDAMVSYKFISKNIGNFDIALNSTYIFNYKQSVVKNGTLAQKVDRPYYPVDFRARGNISWLPISDFLISIYANYTDSYYDYLNGRKIKAWTTFDISASYKIKNLFNNNVFNNVDIQASIINVFNNYPPFYEDPITGLAYDPTNSEPLGRFISLTITAKM